MRGRDGVRGLRTRVARVAGVLGLAALALSSTVPGADAFIYWGDSQNGSIGRAENDGSGVNPKFITGASLPAAIAVSATHIYWANESGKSIGRANIDGTDVDQNFISGISDPSGVAVTGSSVFWSSNLINKVGRANLDGSSPNPTFVAAENPCGVAVDSGHVYWVNATGPPSLIGRASLNGSSPVNNFVTIPGTSFPCGVAVDSANIYWSDLGFFGGGTSIGRASASNGLGADASIIGEAAAPCGIAVFGSRLYWANSQTSTIGRANSDTTGVDQKFIATGGGQICGVAVDSLASPPAAEPESVDASAPQTKIVKGPGTRVPQGEAVFRFKSSEGGSRFQCKIDRKKTARCRSPRRYRHLKRGRHIFRVWATDAAGNKDPTPAKRRFRVPRR
jgi:hypothetical protein